MNPAWVPAALAALALAGAVLAWGPRAAGSRGPGSRAPGSMGRWPRAVRRGRGAPVRSAVPGAASLSAASASATGPSVAGAPAVSPGAVPAVPAWSPAVPLAVPPDVVPLVCDAVAALLQSGLGLEDALEAAGSGHGPAPGLAPVGRMLRWGAGWDEAWAAAPGCDDVAGPLALSRLTGAPAVALLRDAARQARKRRERLEEAEAAAITVRLVLPLGLCALPAFLCLGIVPVALALLPWA